MRLNYISLACCVFLLQAATLFAQGTRPDGRTLDTKIADLLNRVPTQDAANNRAIMEDLASLQQEGLTKIALMLSPSANNTNIEYALAGFAFYASQPGKEEFARMAVQAYGRALGQLDYAEGQDFLLNQLVWIGQDDAAPFVEPFLHNDRLSARAAQVLEDIGTEAAEQALLLALRTSSSDEHKMSFIQALGGMNSRQAVSEITPYTKSLNEGLRKVALYALGEIGDPKSGKVLLSAAKDAGATYEPTNATSTYLRYLSKLAERGDVKAALKGAKALHKLAGKAGQYHTQAGALGLMVQLEPVKAPKLLADAMAAGDAQYRGAAIRYALQSGLVKNVGLWAPLISRLSPDGQTAVIGMLGQGAGTDALQTLRPLLSSSEPSVQLAAIDAITLAGGESALDDVLGQLNGAEGEKLAAIQTALMSMPGSKVTDAVAGSVANASPKVKVALLEILAARSAEKHMPVVMAQLNDGNAAVQNAAFAALGKMANESHSDQLLAVMKATQNAEHLKHLQEALVVSVLHTNSQRAQTDWVIRNLSSLQVDKQVYLYEILGQTGGEAAMSQLEKIFDQGNNAQKRAVIQALNNSKDSGAPLMLLDIARSEGSDLREEALQGYVKLIPVQSWTDENKVIHLRNALEITSDNNVKNSAIRALGGLSTFQALITSGKYLDEEATQQIAARAVMNIVSNTDEFYGEVVRALVEKTRDVISGQDSQYYKTSLQKFLDEMPAGRGYYPLFNEKDLTGWQGVFSNPIKRSQLDEKAYAREQEKANKVMEEGWEAKDGLLIFKGKGENIGTVKHYGDFEMYVDWKITADGDAGIYLRGTPQVQIWDTARTNVGAEVGSGGLYNNTKHESKPSKVADNPVEEWNTFYMKIVGDKVTVDLNGVRVVDDVVLENYWDRSQPLFPREMIELQAHGTYVAYRDIYIRELDASEPFALNQEEKAAGFEVLFDGTNLDKWTGNKTDYVVENGNIAIYPDRGGSGNLFTEKEYGDFEFRFEFKLTPGANNGLGIRSPLTGDAAYAGMELQILDNTADIYRNLKEYQFHGSLYGIAAAKRGALKPVGEWNYQEVVVKGNKIQVILNGTKILDADITDAKANGALDGREHPGLFRDRGHIGFLGHGDVVYFRNIRVRELE